MEQETEIEQIPSIALDIDSGLSKENKTISSKYFYDDEGSKIFQEIMKMPEYYLTDTELEILSCHSEEIVNSLDFGNEFSIIEFGAGDGKKTMQLLSYLANNNFKCYYRPVDISSEAIKSLEKNLHQKLPDLNIQSLQGDYFKVLSSLPQRVKPALFLFLGSNIGNYEFDDSVSLLKNFGAHFQTGDKFLIGFDLVKNPRIIIEAYDDSHGITRRFNLNLLNRFNRELGMNFDPKNFEFYPYYNPSTGELRSCLVSLKSQKVRSDVLDKEYHFSRNELIHTELSKKYRIKEIEKLATACGFKVVNNFFDSKEYFADSLWVKI